MRLPRRYAPRNDKVGLMNQTPTKKGYDFPTERIEPLAFKGDGSSPIKSSLLVIDCINELCHDIEP